MCHRMRPKMSTKNLKGGITPKPRNLITPGHPIAETLNPKPHSPKALSRNPYLLFILEVSTVRVHSTAPSDCQTLLVFYC